MLFCIFKIQRRGRKYFVHSLKILQSDYGSEFTIKQFTNFLSYGIMHYISCPFTLQQNGVAERKNCHIVETNLTFLSHASVPKPHWDSSFQTTVCLINRLLTLRKSRKIPCEHLFHQSPSYDIFWVFGGLCYPNLHPYMPHKLDFRSLPYIFTGYHPNYKGFKCPCIPTGCIFISRNVVSNEFCFPFHKSPPRNVDAQYSSMANVRSVSQISLLPLPPMTTSTYNQPLAQPTESISLPSIPGSPISTAATTVVAE